MIEKTVHEGHNVKRIREILGVKQDALAIDLGLSQQAISSLEQKESLDKDLLDKIAKILKVPAEAIKNFSEESAINIIAGTVNNHDQSALFFQNPVFNTLDKYIEQVDEIKQLYQALLKEKDEKISLLEKLLERK
jgi:transcriptional regulator with XRE-family HTH domain